MKIKTLWWKTCLRNTKDISNICISDSFPNFKMITETQKPALKISNKPNEINSLGIAQRLNKYRVDFTQEVSNPSDIFYFESNDDQMRYFGIRKESLIVVDRSIEIKSEMIIVCCVDGEWLTRKMVVKGESTFLCINDGMDARLNITGKQIHILGAVTWICQPLHHNKLPLCPDQKTQQQVL